ncbi:MAG TPA: DUF4038 domain-containing protein [Nocardioides sp.]|nr:DUF4038 domain-containing protein [Nocardioides sp.]
MSGSKWWSGSVLACVAALGLCGSVASPASQAATARSGIHERASDARVGHAASSSRPHFIKKVSRSGRYFLDQRGHPVMLRGDTVWGLVFNAGRYGHGTTWRSDIRNYLSARAAKGFNTVYVAALGNTINEGRYDTGATWDGISPWVGGSTSNIGPHVGTLNNAYWRRVDYLMRTAKADGITVMLDVIYGDDINENGRPGAMYQGHYPSDGQMKTYGRMLGNRYKSFPNLIWMIGGDYFGNANAKVALTLRAIRKTGSKQLISVENWDKTSSYQTALGRRFAQWADIYSYAPTYRWCERAWAQRTRPLVWADGYYDQDSGASNNQLYRQEVGWALTSGSRGSVYGAEGLWGWSSGSLQLARHPSPAARQMVTAWNAVSKLHGWYRLVPDIHSGKVLTGDRGTKINSDDDYTSPSNDYITGSITSNGTLALIYLPRGGTAHVTWAHMGRSHRTARWLDPTTGALRSTRAGRKSYQAPPNNAAGQSDWYLVLRAAH